MSHFPPLPPTSIELLWVCWVHSPSSLAILNFPTSVGLGGWGVSAAHVDPL